MHISRRNIRFAQSLHSELGADAGGQSSRPGELPPEPLTEPYVNLSIHTALRKLKSKRVTALPVIEEFRVFSIDSPEPFP
jgi:hypothetical protein